MRIGPRFRVDVGRYGFRKAAWSYPADGIPEFLVKFLLGPPMKRMTKMEEGGLRRVN
jgi:hypothetical protein